MTNNLATIRAALEQATGGRPSNIAAAQAALAALAELERAAAEPVATVCLITDRFAHNHCIEAQLQVDPSTQLPIGTKLYATPPAPVAAIRDPTREMVKRVCADFYGSEYTGADSVRNVLRLWQRELGPSLGLVELKEPTPEECERIYSFWIDAQGCNGRTPGERMGRIMFDAVRAVMWPKEVL